MAVVKRRANCVNDAGGEPRSHVDDVPQAFAHVEPSALVLMATESGAAFADALLDDDHSVSDKPTVIASSMTIARDIARGYRSVVARSRFRCPGPTSASRSPLVANGESHRYGPASG